MYAFCEDLIIGQISTILKANNITCRYVESPSFPVVSFIQLYYSIILIHYYFYTLIT